MYNNSSVAFFPPGSSQSENTAPAFIVLTMRFFMKFLVNSPIVLIDSDTATFKIKTKYIFSQNAPIDHSTFFPNSKY